MSPDRADDGAASMGPLQQFVAALAADAAKVLSEKPYAEIVGLIAESGTVECRRARTLVEQGTGKEYANENFAGLLPPSALPQILGATFPPEALKWMMNADRVGQLHILICARDEVRVATVKLPATGA
jgi:hypothetical protein